MSIRRVLPLALLVLVACSGHTQEQPVTGWTYTCDANPLGDQWADPDFTKLNDGDKNPSKSAIFSGGRVVIEITLPEETRVRRVVAQVQRHNDNYKLTKTTVEALQAGQFVQVGANNEGFWGPTAQSAFTIAIPVDVTTRKLRVIFHAASIVSIQEIELFGEPHQQADTGEYALAFDNSPGARATEVDADNDGRSELVLENPRVRLVFEPEGGLCRSFALKDAGAELVGGSGRFGLLRDQLWSPNYSFAERGYFSEIETTPQKARIDLRLAPEHVQRRAGNPLLGKGIIKRILIDDAAAGAIDQADCRLHHRNLIGPDHVQGLGVLRHVNGDEIGFAEDSFEFVRHFDAQFLGVCRRRQRVIPKDLHVQTMGHFRHRHADAAQTDDAKDFVVELIAGVFLAIPGAGLKTVASLDHVAAHRQHQSHGMLGRTEGVAARGVHHKDAFAGRGGHVDVVDADACTGDRFESAGICKNLGVDLRFTADD